MQTCVIIPAYNEAGLIGEIIGQVRQQYLNVVVVDDGSTDDTCRIASDNGAIVLRNERNEGKGASLIRGFSYALQENYDSVIVMDADGQHLPQDIPYFMRLASYSNSGIFIGNRMSKIKNMPRLRVLTNKFMSGIISCVARQNIPDTQCGFRLIKKEVLERLKLKTSKYETESEILIQTARLGFKIESVPIKTVYNFEKSSIRPVRDTIRFVRFIFREIFIR